MQRVLREYVRPVIVSNGLRILWIHWRVLHCLSAHCERYREITYVCVYVCVVLQSTSFLPDVISIAGRTLASIQSTCYTTPLPFHVPPGCVLSLEGRNVSPGTAPELVVQTEQGPLLSRAQRRSLSLL